jgi:hypothetical protein
MSLAVVKCGERCGRKRLTNGRLVDRSVVKTIAPAFDSSDQWNTAAKAGGGCNGPVAEVAADDEKVFGVSKKWRESCCALLQNSAPQVADHDGHQLHAGIEQCGDEWVVKFEADGRGLGGEGRGGGRIAIARMQKCMEVRHVRSGHLCSRSSTSLFMTAKPG